MTLLPASSASAGRVRRTAFVGGGSGGHLFPGIALGHRLLTRDPDSQLLFLSSGREIDSRILQSSGLPTDRVETEQLTAIRAKDATRRPWAFWPALTVAVVKALIFLRRFRPQVVVGLGGISSVPAVLAARCLRIPVVLLEQNVVAGRATRLLARFATVTCTGLPLEPASQLQWPGPVEQCGIPLRREIEELWQEQRPDDDTAAAAASEVIRSVLLVLGGSQGASRINRLIQLMIAEDNVLPSSWQIVHQCGSQDLDDVRSYYDRIRRPATVTPFLDNMAESLQTATLVVCRAGATTIAELACAGKPAILIPYSHATDQHQQKNAWWLESSGAAYLVDEQAADAVEHLARAVRNCVSQDHVRRTLGRSIARVATPRATEKIIDVLDRCAGIF